MSVCPSPTPRLSRSFYKASLSQSGAHILNLGLVLSVSLILSDFNTCKALLTTQPKSPVCVFVFVCVPVFGVFVCVDLFLLSK